MSCPPMISSVCTPTIYWYQTDLQIVLRIMLHDVKKYFIHAEKDHFQFSTLLNDKKYYVCLPLFGGVIAEETNAMNRGREFKVSLTKAQKGFPWLRLNYGDCKWPQIHVDLDHLESRKKEAFYERESFDVYKKRNGITQIRPAASSSEDSDDETSDKFFD